MKNKVVTVKVKGGVVAVFPVPKGITVYVKDYDCEGGLNGRSKIGIR